ncbi:MAG: CDP-alcohol phosphatidyltransferase family protein [Bacillota bacterium]
MIWLGDWISRAEESLRDRYLGPLVLFLIPPRVKPNHLTALRAILVFAAVVMYISGVSLQIQLATLIIAALTDCFDGILARARNLVSRRGAYFDHAVDWLLGGWAGILALISGLLPVVIIVLIVIPQAGIIIVDRIRAAAISEEIKEKRILTITMGAANFKPSPFSRFQFFTVLTGFFLLLLSKAYVSPALHNSGFLFLYLTVGLAWIQLIDTSVRMAGKKTTENCSP